MNCILFLLLVNISYSLSHLELCNQSDYSAPSNQTKLISEYTTLDHQMCGHYTGCELLDNGFNYVDYYLYGEQGSIPISYSLALYIYYGDATVCNKNQFAIKEVRSGSIKGATQPGNYIATVNNVYYTLSEDGLGVTGCKLYHSANVEFDIRTSKCPYVLSELSKYEFNHEFTINIVFTDSGLFQTIDNFIFNMNLVDTSTCTINDNSESILKTSSILLTCIIIIVVLLIILAIVLVFLLVVINESRTLRIISSSSKA